MPRSTGMYRRSELIRLAGQVTEVELRTVGRLVIEHNCATGKHEQETDAETGNEVCRRCGDVIDDYSDIAALTARMGDR